MVIEYVGRVKVLESVRQASKRKLVKKRMKRETRKASRRRSQRGPVNYR